MSDDANFRDMVFQLKRTHVSGFRAGHSTVWARTPSIGHYLWPADTGRPQRADSLLPQIIRSIDNAAVIIATIIALHLQRGMLTHQQAVTNAVAGIFALLVFFLTAHRPRLDYGQNLKKPLAQLRFLTPPMILAGFAQLGMSWWMGIPEEALPYTSGGWILLASASLVVTRGTATVMLRQDVIARRLRRKIAVVGYDRHAFGVADRLQDDLKSNVDVIGIFCDDPPLATNANVDGTIDDLVDLSQNIDLYGVVIALPPSVAPDEQLLALSLKLRRVLADVFILPYLVQGPEIVLPVQSIGGTSFMVLQRRPLDSLQKLHKRALDLILSLTAFIMFFVPLFIIVAPLIKLDSPGPVLFRQPRRGCNNRNFNIYKFRTMHVMETDLFAARQTSRGDPRVTRVGKWLRRLSIDELPQLLNVLRGEMSLVGPRPHALHTMVEGELLDRALGDYLIRYQVKPGITGWAQVNGARGELVTREDLRRRVAFDLEYIQRWSLRFDLKIMLMTAAKEIFSKYAF